LTTTLSSESDLMVRFRDDVGRAGLVGEKRNAVLVLLSAVSAKLAKPLHVTLQGTSAAGKNYLMARVGSFLPVDWARSLTGMSPKALMHSGEEEYRHRPVFIAEYEGVSGADYAIRTFQSEQMIEWEFVESSKRGISKKTRRVRGPAAFIQATTRPSLHAENETRLLFTRMDESAEQTQAILRQQAIEAAMGSLTPPVSLFAPWRELIAGLKLNSVVIPFAPKLVPNFPAKTVRSRRDFPKLLGLIEASALLNQHQRETQDTCIIAHASDYAVAKELFEHCLSSTPDKAIGELLHVSEALHGTGENFNVADLMRELRWGKSKVYEVLARAEDLGCVGKTEGWGRYAFLRRNSDDAIELPSGID